MMFKAGHSVTLCIQYVASTIYSCGFDPSTGYITTKFTGIYCSFPQDLLVVHYE